MLYIFIIPLINFYYLKKSTKKISEAEKNLPKTVNLKVSKYESESFDFFCPKVNRAAILTIYYEEENSDEGFLAKTKVVQRWGGVWESNPRIEVNEDGGLHTQITITDLTLDDKGKISYMFILNITITEITSDTGRF